MPYDQGQQMPYQQGPMKPGTGNGDMYKQDYGKPGYGKPMGQPKSYVPYYVDAGPLNSNEGGSFEATIDIPEELAGTYRISITLRTAHTYPYHAYNWFYNNDASVCNGENG